jgi:hypothetical protein
MKIHYLLSFLNPFIQILFRVLLLFISMQNILYRLIKPNSLPNLVRQSFIPEANVYPNPFSSEVSFFIDSNMPSALTLYNVISGKMVKRIFIGSIILDTNQLRPEFTFMK